MVRAKFKCIEKSESGQVKMEVVCGGSPENDSFFKYTPSGQLTIGTVNEAALGQFEVGKAYYLDFSPAE